MPTAPSPVMALLAAGCPITLLCDLADPDGPDSIAMNAAERSAHDPRWDEAATTRLRARLTS